MQVGQCYRLSASSLTTAVRRHSPVWPLHDTADMAADITFSSTVSTQHQSVQVAALKQDILQLGAALDRGQAYNPTAGKYYEDKMHFAKKKVEALIACQSLPKSLKDLDGEWELVFSSVPHGIFRSSPFFLAIQDAYNAVNAADKAELFFKLHELQTCSWGISKIGRVASPSLAGLKCCQHLAVELSQCLLSTL